MSIFTATCGINRRYDVINLSNWVSFDPIHNPVAQGQQENKKSDQHPGRKNCSDKTVLMVEVGSNLFSFNHKIEESYQLGEIMAKLL